MAKLALTEKALVDLKGANYRAASEAAQFMLDLLSLPKGAKFMDLGLVEYNHTQYYASVYWPAPVEAEE